MQRWLKFVKYLPAYEWEPHVFTPENPSFAVKDASLERDVPPEAEVIRFPIREPYDVFFRISGWFGGKKEATPAALIPRTNRSLFQTISAWVRGNLFIPDPRRFWTRPSVQFLSDYLADNHIGTIITTGPPHSMHLIGLRLKLKFPHLRWLADFRDPWSEWGLWDSLMVSQAVMKIHRKLERRVLRAADEIITITPFYVKRFEALAQRPVRLLTNGFDEDDFSGMTYVDTGQFIIRHIGVVNEKCDPRPFMEALEQEMERDADFARHLKVEFIGDVHAEFREFVANNARLERITSFRGNVPHQELIQLYGSSSLLLLILTGYKDAEGFLPGKLFEYFATRLPVLGVGPTSGNAASLLKETGAGIMVGSDDRGGMLQAVRGVFERWSNGEDIRVRDPRVERFSRKTITRQLVEILSAS